MIRKSMNFFAAIIPVLLLMNCGSKESPEPELQIPVSVSVIEATAQPSAYQSIYSGTIEPIQSVRLSTKIMGWVERIYFEEGEKVKKGEILVKLRSQDLEARQAQAEAAIDEAEVFFSNVQTNLQRIESLHEKKAATQKELDDTRAAYASALARKRTAEEMKNEVEELLAYTVLQSPFDGVVTRKMVQEGDLANPGQPILQVENMAQVKIVAKVPESEVQALEIGMPVAVLVQASGLGANGKHTDYRIDRIVPSADPVSRQFDIHVVADNSKGIFNPGMFARITAGKSLDMTLLVPDKAVFRRGQLEGLFVIDSENTARLRWIRTGTEDNGLKEVLSGLNIGEQVVVEGARLLSDGQRVEVKQ